MWVLEGIKRGVIQFITVSALGAVCIVIGIDPPALLAGFWQTPPLWLSHPLLQLAAFMLGGLCAFAAWRFWPWRKERPRSRGKPTPTKSTRPPELRHAFRVSDGYAELILQVPRGKPMVSGVRPEMPNFSNSLINYNPQDVLRYPATRQGENHSVEIGPGSVKYYRFARINSTNGTIELAPEDSRPYQTGARQCAVKFRVNSTNMDASTFYCAIEIDESNVLRVRPFEPGRM